MLVRQEEEIHIMKMTVCVYVLYTIGPAVLKLFMEDHFNPGEVVPVHSGTSTPAS